MFWVVLAVLVIVLLAGIRYATAMPGASHAGSPGPLSEEERRLRDALAAHVSVLATAIGERNVWRPHALADAAHYIEQRMAACGLAAERQDYQVANLKVCNLEATIPGTRHPDEIVVVGAHYDSVPGCPGANDNASGVAAVLELGRRWRERPTIRTLRLVAFVNEEPPFCFTGSMGSRVYARRCRRRGDRIVAMLSLETIGYYTDRAGSQTYPFPFGLFYPKRGDFIGFVGNLSSRALVRRCVAAFRRHAEFPSQGTAAPGYLPGIFWSDHWSFWREGYRAVMVTDTAPFRYPQYHRPEDTPDKLDYDHMAKVVAGLDKVIATLVGHPLEGEE